MAVATLDIPPSCAEQWPSVPNVITAEELQEIYATLRRLEEQSKAQAALLQQRIEADVVRDQAIEEMNKLLAELRVKEGKDKHKTPTPLRVRCHSLADNMI